MPTRVRSFSKINLGLAIGAVRPDGFHELTTLYQTLAAHDLITLTAEPVPEGGNRIVLVSNDRRVPLDGRNTVCKMLDRVLSLPPFSSRSWMVRIEIEKRLPVQGGLGGGSANAAAALIAFERETGLALEGAERLRIAAEVGSDVPLFLVGGAVLGLGRGELVVPMADLVLEAEADTALSFHASEGSALLRGAGEGAGCEVVLALPAVGVSTPQAFREWDREAAGLSSGDASGKLEELSRALASAFGEPLSSSGVFPAIEREGLARQPLSALVRTGIRNDFEQVVFRQHPFLGTIKRALMSAEPVSRNPAGRGALYGALSGSGSALFGLYADDGAAQAAEARVAALGVRTMRTHLLGRSAYWRQMFVPTA